MQRILCPHCHKKLKYEEGLEGGTYKCPKCGRSVTLGTPAQVVRRKKRAGIRGLRTLVWPVVGLVVLGCLVFAVRYFQEGAKQRERDAHPVVVR